MAGILEHLIHNRLTLPQYVGVLGQAACLARRAAPLLRTAADHQTLPGLAQLFGQYAGDEQARAALAEQDLAELGRPLPEPGAATQRLLELIAANAGGDSAYRLLGFVEVWGRLKKAISADRLIPAFGQPPRRYLDSLAEADRSGELATVRAQLTAEQRGDVGQIADAAEQCFVQFLIEAATMTGVVIAPGRANWSSRLRPAASEEPQAAADPSASGLIFHVAATMDEVVAAWRMVYRAYLQAGLIPANVHRMHAAPQCVHASTAVIYGSIRSVVVSTLSAFVDPDTANPQLPLDRVYGPQLDALRHKGRRLMEVGLFADRRRSLSRTAQTLFQLMRYAFHFGARSEVTDFVIGVHPRHARFYMRSFGFETFGPVYQYAAVNNNPVVLLRGDLREQLSKTPLHPALQFFVDHPVAGEMFDRRVPMTADTIAASPIEAFLNDYANRQPLSKSA